MKLLYCEIVLTIPEVGTSRHWAEREELDSTQCRILRMLEFEGTSTIAGVYTPSTLAGKISVPAATVPHPATYDSFPDISSRSLEAQDFEFHWQRALKEFPELQS